MKKYMLSVSAYALAMSASSVFAQENAAGSTDVNDIDEEIIVVSDRFQNSIVNRLPIDPKELPFSVDIIDEATIEERGFFNPFDILETVPNITKRQTQSLAGGATYLVRGLVGTALTNNRPESVSRGAGRREISYIERIEVAKGPTSILLGPVVPGGVINQVTKSPKDEDFVDLTLRGGSYDTYRAEVDANFGEVFGSETVGFRITAAYEDAGTPQELENTETIGIRPVIEIDFSDRTRFQGSIAYTKREGGQGSSFPVNADGSVPDTIDAETFFGLESDRKGRDIYYDAEFQHEFLDDLKLVVRGSHQNADFEYRNAQGGGNYAGGRGLYSDPDDVFINVYHSHGSRDQDVTYGDVQLLGEFEAFGQQQDWVIGGTYKREETTSLWKFGGMLGVVDVRDIDAAVFGEPDFTTQLDPFFIRINDLYSVYGEMNIRPLENLTIVAGARYDELTEDNFRRGATVATVTKYDDFTFRIGATYSFNEEVNGYVSYAESFIPQFGTLRNGNSIGPETATNYEIGIKGSFLGGRVNLTAAAFMLTRQNVATADPDNMPGQPSYVVPTGEQEHNGFEVSANIQATDALELQLAYGYVDAEVTSDINPGGGMGAGDPVPLSPKNTFSAYGSYTVQDGSLADLQIGVGVRGISSRPSPRFNLVYDGYTLVDANVSYPINDNFQVQLNVHNLLDETYRESVGYDSGTTSGGHRFGNPRTAYLTLKAQF